MIVPLIATLMSLGQPAEVQPTDASTRNAGKIVFYRGGAITGAAVACPIRYKGEQLVELGRGKAFTWDVEPGRYILENKTSSVEVSVEPGETRYVRCQIKTGFLSGRADLQIVDGTEYAEKKDQLEAPGS